MKKEVVLEDAGIIIINDVKLEILELKNCNYLN